MASKVKKNEKIDNAKVEKDIAAFNEISNYENESTIELVARKEVQSYCDIFKSHLLKWQHSYINDYTRFVSKKDTMGVMSKDLFEQLDHMPCEYSTIRAIAKSIAEDTGINMIGYITFAYHTVGSIMLDIKENKKKGETVAELLNRVKSNSYVAPPTMCEAGRTMQMHTVLLIDKYVYDTYLKANGVPLMQYIYEYMFKITKASRIRIESGFTAASVLFEKDYGIPLTDKLYKYMTLQDGIDIKTFLENK